MSYRIVYAVSMGEYSAYHILFLCESRELAEKMIPRFEEENWYRPFVEEFQLTDSEDDVIPRKYYMVEVDQNGNEIERELEDDSFDSIHYIGHDHFSNGWNNNITGLGAVGKSTRDFDHALKIARDELMIQKSRETEDLKTGSTFVSKIGSASSLLSNEIIENKTE